MEGTHEFSESTAITDKLDGYIARKHNLITNMGKLLDPLADKLLISAALILMVSQQLIYSWIAFAIIGKRNYYNWN
ncbi:CDP-alcohol phosphatidyltransferase family protein [Paenibacillus sp. IITD108]|uniref:CDP-alcohol phosphatidyltransferase family protein n=1 Tax=Paenibacillus sp. IITD108 TaxID=3116649 RepID=UPI002F42D076